MPIEFIILILWGGSLFAIYHLARQRGYTQGYTDRKKEKSESDLKAARKLTH